MEVRTYEAGDVKRLPTCVAQAAKMDTYFQVSKTYTFVVNDVPAAIMSFLPHKDRAIVSLMSSDLIKPFKLKFVKHVKAALAFHAGYYQSKLLWTEVEPKYEKWVKLLGFEPVKEESGKYYMLTNLVTEGES